MVIDLPGIIGWQVTTLLALIAADIVSGIGKAIRAGEFDIGHVANFYKSMVIPYLLGYLALSIVVQFAAVEFLADELIEPFSDVALTAAWGTITVVIGNSILGNLRLIWSGTSG